MGRFVDIQLQDFAGCGQSLHRPFGQPKATAETGGDDLCTLLLGGPSGVKGDRVVGENTGDHKSLAIEDHRASRSEVVAEGEDATNRQTHEEKQ